MGTGTRSVVAEQAVGDVAVPRAHPSQRARKSHACRRHRVRVGLLAADVDPVCGEDLCEGVMPEASPADFRDLNDDALLSQCRWDAFRGPGPGGQKRNKTSNTMRLTHQPTGVNVVAGESRSQSEN